MINQKSTEHKYNETSLNRNFRGTRQNVHLRGNFRIVESVRYRGDTVVESVRYRGDTVVESVRYRGDNVVESVRYRGDTVVESVRYR